MRARRLLRIAAVGVGLFVGLSLLIVVLYRFVPPPVTPLMVLRVVEGESMRRDWLPTAALPQVIAAAVLASEDQRFCLHDGFDYVEMDRAWQAYRAGGSLRGASTLSQQTAKNLFLLPVRSFLRKGLEAYFTVLIEAIWPKWRIAQVYLDTVEWGPGVYGVEAGSQYAFGHPAARLSRREAALLAAILPNPRRWSAAAPTAYIRRRADIILTRMERQEADTSCVASLGR